MLQKLPSFAKVTPQDLNRIIDAVNRGADIVAAPPLEVTRFGGRVQLRVTGAGWMGAVTARDDLSSSSSSSGAGGNRYRYTVQAVERIANGQWQYVPDGQIVSAWEWNDSAVAVGTTVWVEPWGDLDWRFEHCCGTAESSSSSSRSSSSESSRSQSSQSSESSSSESSQSSSSQSSQSGSSASSSSRSSGSSSSGSSGSSSSSSSESSSSSSSESSSSVSSASSSSGSSQSGSSGSSQSGSSQSDSSGSSQSSDSCSGSILEFISDLSFDATTCTLTVTKTRVCLPSCITVLGA